MSSSPVVVQRRHSWCTGSTVVAEPLPVQIDRRAYFDASPRLRLCKIGRLIGCPLMGWSGRAPACADRRHDCAGDDGKAVYLLLGFIVGAGIDCIPLEADAPALGPLYHGLERHSASVPDAVA